MKKKTLIIGLIVLAAVVLFVMTREDAAPVSGEHVLVYYEPVQCNGNSWERDWFETRKGSPDDLIFPKDQEVEIIKAYYAKQEVIVLEVKSEATNPIVCQSCSCSRGDILSLLIARSDVETMRDLGFELEKPEVK